MIMALLREVAGCCESLLMLSCDILKHIFSLQGSICMGSRSDKLIYLIICAEDLLCARKGYNGEQSKKTITQFLHSQLFRRFKKADTNKMISLVNIILKL